MAWGWVSAARRVVVPCPCASEASCWVSRSSSSSRPVKCGLRRWGTFQTAGGAIGRGKRECREHLEGEGCRMPCRYLLPADGIGGGLVVDQIGDTAYDQAMNG